MSVAHDVPPEHDVSADVRARAAERSWVERSVRAGAKRAIRRAGEATASLRPLPDFLIVGAKRGGTTSFMNYLQQHDGIVELFPRLEKIKGLYFFDEQYERGEQWYRSHFATRATRCRLERRTGHRSAAGEASPYYLFHPLAPARAAALVPDAHIVALLRNPIDRAYSHWKERRTNDTEPLAFADALDAECDRLAGEEARLRDDPGARSFSHRHQSYLTQSAYAPMLTRWFDAFGRDRVLVMTSEEVFADPQAAVDAVGRRLGLPARPLRHRDRLNAAPSADLDPVTRRDLARRLASAIAETEALLGRDLNWV